jgi:manganese efflux pump family protein
LYRDISKFKVLTEVWSVPDEKSRLQLRKTVLVSNPPSSGFYSFSASRRNTMSFLEIFLIALGLASDAFAVSISAGSTGVTKEPRAMLRLSFHFGLFQFLMPIIGWLTGLSVVYYIQSFDHWIVFGLLLGVAVHMIRSAQNGNEQTVQQDPSRGMMLVILSVATSLDALAIGLSLALLHISIWYPAVVIGIVTGIVSFIGILLGRQFSKKIGKQAAVAGGILLILIAIRILLAHLLSF